MYHTVATFRWRLFETAARLVKHGREIILKACPELDSGLLEAGRSIPSLERFARTSLRYINLDSQGYLPRRSGVYLITIGISLRTEDKSV